MNKTFYSASQHGRRLEHPMRCVNCGCILKRGYAEDDRGRFCFSCHLDLEEDDPADGARMLGSVLLAAFVAGLALMGYLVWRWIP